MDQKRVIETIGSITKMEHLSSIGEGSIDNSMVLNNSTPFPGLKHQSNEEQTNLSSYFVVLRYRYAPEKINRINCKLFKEKELARYPSYGEIITQNTILPCIRLKSVELSEIASLQESLKKNNLKFVSYKPFDRTCRIKIFKTFRLVEVADDLYRDLSEGEKFYIHVNDTLNWKRFEYITKKIKQNLNNKQFDPALGVIYRFCGPRNVIRIYDYDKTLDRALSLKKWYLSEIKKEINISAMH